MADIIFNHINTVPPSTFFASLDGNITLIANGALGNADTSNTYVDLGKAGFNIFSLQYVIQATTITIEASNDLPSVSNASAAWTDVTLILTNGSASSFLATGSLTVSTAFPWSRLRFKRVTTNATNALSLILTRMVAR